MGATSALVFGNLDCLSLFAYSKYNSAGIYNFYYCFYFFPKSALPNWECSLSMDAAYTWTFTVCMHIYTYTYHTSTIEQQSIVFDQ